MTELAIFDLDYTLTKRGTWGRFISQSLKGRPIALARLWLTAGWLQWRYKSGRSPRIAVKSAMMRLSIAGLSRARLEVFADQFVDADLREGLNPSVMDALKDHQSKGHKILIASAAVDLLVDRYTQALGAHGFVSTEFAWSKDGTLLGTFASSNCYGEEKLERVKTWMADQCPSPTKITTYSDSRSDAPILEFADRAIIVAPNKKTQRYAQQKGFEIWN